MSGERVRSYLMEHGVKYATHAHPKAYTTAEIAEAEQVPGDQMAKVVMLIADEAPVMAVLPGSRMINIDKAQETLGAGSVRLANEGEFSSLFPDCEPGAEPPFGALYDVPMLVDEGLQRPDITFNAGTHEETITLSLSDYLELTHPTQADLAAV
jgi:Ala-tRNA(Pro) deacylase